MAALVGPVLLLMLGMAGLALMLGLRRAAGKIVVWVVAIALLASVLPALWSTLSTNIMDGFTNWRVVVLAIVGVLVVALVAISYFNFYRHREKLRRTFPRRPTSMKRRRSQW